MEITPVITIDGPSGVGKSTLCNVIARFLKWNTLDSGMIYRILALEALYYRTDLTSEQALISLTKKLDMRFITIDNKYKLIFQGRDVSKQICFQKVADIASQIAILPRVREALLYCQRKFRKAPGLIANGRDMGTVVFPDALAKIFLDATPNERANRRMLQLQKHGLSVNFNKILLETKKRDDRDRNRNISPLIPAKDALMLDSTRLTVEQTINKTLKYVSKKLYITVI